MGLSAPLDTIRREAETGLLSIHDAIYLVAEVERLGGRVAVLEAALRDARADMLSNGLIGVMLRYAVAKIDAVLDSGENTPSNTSTPANDSHPSDTKSATDARGWMRGLAWSRLKRAVDARSRSD